MALKSSSNLFWTAEYFTFQEKVSISFIPPLHANANEISALVFGHFGDCQAKIVILDFLEFKALKAKKATLCFIST